MHDTEQDTFLTELKQYSVSDLELIYRTQKELYSPHELELLKELLEQKKISLKETTAEFDFGVTLFCIVSILTPISGLAAGVIMLIKGTSKWKTAGKKTLLAALISFIIRIFLYSGGFSI